MVEKPLANDEKLASPPNTGKEQLLVLKLDITKVEDITAAFTAAKDAFGRIDVCRGNSDLFHRIHKARVASGRDDGDQAGSQRLDVDDDCVERSVNAREQRAELSYFNTGERRPESFERESDILHPPR
ncbi:hypothetical protein C8R44DRAFT_752418 [Mycena epipterygia]|nr:hypothetical protein C8R44DRAFT_752418 [Mycena epipterygia]